MSIEAIAWASKLTLPPRDKFVLIALSNFANDDFSCWPKHSTLADWTGYDERTIRRALAALEDEDIIESERQYRDDGSQRNNLYHLRVGVVTKSTPPGHSDHPPRADSPPPLGRVTYQEPSLEPSVEPKDKTSSSDDDNGEEKRSKKPSAPIEEMIALWNDESGDLAKTRVVSSEIETKIRALHKRHGDDLLDFAKAGIAIVRRDEWWLGSKAKKVRRAGAPYGLVNYLRHLESYANQALAVEDVESDFDGVEPGSSWYATVGAVRIDSIDGGRAHCTVVKSTRDDLDPGDKIELKRSDLTHARNR